MQKSDCIIGVEHVSKFFGDKAVLNDVNLSVRKGEFVTILGPSGCGKTTLLRLIAGFQTASEGVITIAGKDITQTPPHKRPVNTVFQKYALFPHLNVFNNIAFGLKLKKLPGATIEKKVKQALRMVGMTDYEDRDVDSLSGGQQQRVAIARAIVNEPEVLLLDEPLAALDLKMRKDMQMELKEMHQKLGITFVYVTHDQEEALTLSDTIVVMSEGRIQQIGVPTDIYNEPINSFVADFIGESNILNGVMIKDKAVTFCGHEFECVDTGFGEQMQVDVVIRPNDIYINPEDYWMSVCRNAPSMFIYDNSYVKCRELTLSYNVPKSWLKNVVSGLTVSFVARNPFIVWKNIPNIDPDSNYNNTTGMGLEYGSLPSRRSYGFNVNVKF